MLIFECAIEITHSALENDLLTSGRIFRRLKNATNFNLHNLLPCDSICDTP